MKLGRFVKQTGRRLQTVALFVGVVTLFALSMVIGYGGNATITASPSSDTFVLDRIVHPERPVPGEVVHMQFSLFNAEERSVSVTLTEEIPSGVHVLDVGEGAYNDVARYIVWWVDLAAGEEVIVGYEAQIQDAGVGLPFFAYGTTTGGEAAEDAFALHPGVVPISLHLGDTMTAVGEPTDLTVDMRNPFDRPLTIELALDPVGDMILIPELPEKVTLPAGEQRILYAQVVADEGGQYPIAITPRIGGVSAGEGRQVTLTVYASEAERAFLQVSQSEGPIAGGEAVRTHQLRFPAEMLVQDEQLVVTVPLPPGAAYVPGSATVNEVSHRDPIVRDGRLLFYVPSETELNLSYGLLYNDRRVVGDPKVLEEANAQIGVLSIGLVPRLLRGEDSLLALLHGQSLPDDKLREGIVLLNMHDGQVVGEGAQVDIEVDGPAGVDVTLTVNGEEVGEERLGATAVDEVLEREARKFIAVPLQVGENEIVASAVTSDGLLTDRVVVYRVGSPTSVSLDALTPLATGRVRPLIFHIAAADDQGLPPADGTVVTVEVQGGDIVSGDARPDWLGHQLELFDGRGFLLVEPPVDPVELIIEASVADVHVTERYKVTTQVPEWSVLGHGLVRVDVPFDNLSDGIDVQSSLRVVARGPVGEDAVLTAAINTTGTEKPEDPLTELWTGDTSTQGASGAGVGPLFLRLERDLSYVQYGRNTVRFDGRLSGFTKGYDGLHGVWRDFPSLTLQGFYADVPVDTVQELFVGDGTGYYRLTGGPVEPFSEQLAIVVRGKFYPHDVLRVLPLHRSRYYFDANTGQIILTEPLGATDDEGNEIALRVRYRPAGGGLTAPAGGVQALYEGSDWQATGTLLTRPLEDGDNTFVVGLDGSAELGDFTFGLDAAHSVLRSGTGSVPDVGGSAYIVSVGHKDVFGWALTAEHRDVAPQFVGGDTYATTGIVSSLRFNRSFNGLIGVTGSTALSREHAQAPWRRETRTDVRWLSGRLRPEVGWTARDGEGVSSSVSARVGVSGDSSVGRLAYSHEWPVLGSAPTRDSFEAQLEVSRNQRLQVNVDLTRSGPGVRPVANIGLGFTHAVMGDRATTRLRGGYELPGFSDINEGHYVLGATTDVSVNDRNTLLLSLDHRRPVLPTKPSGFGSSLGWRYRHEELGESEWRVDFRKEGDAVKHALQWRGLHPMSERWTLRGNGLLTFDEGGGQRLRVGLGAAYRYHEVAFIAHWMRDTTSMAAHRRTADEWRLQAASRLTDSLVGNVGHARRRTDEATTDKTNIGLVYEWTDRLNLLAELSYLQQDMTDTSHFGGMLGAGYELFEHVWLTAGYGTDQYVGFDVTGAGFDRRRSGAFVQLDFAFDEWSLRRLFNKPSPDRDGEDQQ